MEFQSNNLRVFIINIVRSKVLKCLIAVTIIIVAQLCDAKIATDYRFKLITFEDGLPSIEITQIYQQRNGFIWIGTDRGVSRYDGFEFKHYFYSPGSSTHISNNYITDILEDSRGNIWIATEDGLNKILKDGQITIYKQGTSGPKGLPAWWINALAEDDEGKLWLGSQYGLFSLDIETEEIVNYVPSTDHKKASAPAIYSILQLKNRDIIVGSYWGIYTLNKKTKSIEPYFIKNSEQYLYDDFVTSIISYKEDEILFSTETDGLFSYNVKTGLKLNFRHHSNKKSISDNSITDLVLDQDENLWIGYANRGLSIHAIEDGAFFHIKKREFEPFSIPSDSVRVLFRDHSDVIWVGTADGIALYSPLSNGTQIYYKKPDGSQLSSNTIYHIYESEEGTKWLASNEGIMSLDANTGQVIHYPLLNELGEKYRYQGVWRIEKSGDGHFWLATENGLLLFDRKSYFSENITIKYDLPKQSIYTLLPHDSASVWITGYQDIGLILIDKERGVIQNFLNQTPSRYADGGNFTTSKILASDGAIMLASTDGIFRVDQAGNVKHYPLIENRDFIRTFSIVERVKGEFWIASQGLGLVKMILDENKQASYEYFNTSNGFPSNEVKALLLDEQSLWFVTKNQLFKLSFETMHLQSFPNLFDVSQLMFTENGLSKFDDILYMGSTRGLITVDVTKIMLNQFIAPVKITQIQSADKSLVNQYAKNEKNINELDYQDNDIEFTFAALDYNHSANTRYSYKLEGVDKSWSEASLRRSVSYNNLAYGDYVFKVKGTNSGGVWNEQVAEFNFKVLKPWWFYLIIGLVSTTVCVFALYVLDRRKQLVFLHEKAHIDTLTGIANRFSFNKQLKKVLDSHQGKFGLAIIDLDSFKEVNDTFGHYFGDKLLVEVTARINQCIRSSDYVARLGGDEFAIIMTEYEHMEDVIFITERIKEAVKLDYHIGENDISGSCSIGVAIYPQDGGDAETLLTHADAAMYEAKKDGKNKVFFFNQSLSQTLSRKLKIRTNLKSALKEKQFQLYYQPKYNQFTNQLIGAEALIRWIHPEDGFIPPDVFIAEAESNGTIIDIGEWVMIEACQQAHDWQKLYNTFCRVSINVSAVQIAQPGFVEQVEYILKRTQVDPKLIELEITESVLIESRQQCQKIFKHLQNLGLTIALDDFGVGFSSLSYLTQFSIDTLKIDRSFVSGLKVDTQNYMILKNIYKLAQDLKMQVVAEGVEHKQQLDIIAQFKGALIQGYYYSPAIVADEFEKLLKESKITIR